MDYVFFVVCTYIGEAAFLELRGISSSSLACVCAQIGASCIEADTAKKKKNNWFDGRLKQSREIAEILARVPSTISPSSQFWFRSHGPARIYLWEEHFKVPEFAVFWLRFILFILLLVLWLPVMSPYKLTKLLPALHGEAI